MMFKKLLTTLPFVACAVSKPLNARAVTDFTIYAYGSEDVFGFPVVAINGQYGLHHLEPDRSDQFRPECDLYVLLRPDFSTLNLTVLLVNAMSTRGNFTATIADEGESLFYVPSTSGTIGFTNSTDDSTRITTGFGFYGHVVFLQTGTTMLTEWYAIPTSDSAMWELSWNDQTGEGIPVALRNIAPS
ncbi:hypothetical protein SCAR479_00179 [Seiridium cardinale]|uniref:Uncharacterized protein n=1 Tax=Seiridium cardinale TaxID=138064 RepID=A0ABR2Y9K2_9PEZI